MENTFYKNIIYKKNAYDDLKTFIKLNYANKNVFLITTKSVPADSVANVFNALFAGTENVSQFVARCNFEKDELDLIDEKIKKSKPSIIVSLGGGRCCDVVKYFAHKCNINYVVCPTVATSLAYFSGYCVNPYNSTSSFYAKEPTRVFICEGVIKNSSCLVNINGLCFLHSLRAIYVENIVFDREKDGYITVGLEKLFKKLDAEQTNILLCNEDSNLVLMDLFIDFGFFINNLNLQEYYLINMYELLCGHENNLEQFCGKKMLLCCKAILTLFKEYIELGTLKTLEKNKYSLVANLMNKNNLLQKNIKNNAFFNNFEQKLCTKRNFLDKRSIIFENVLLQLKSLTAFFASVKSVYKHGIEISGNYQPVFNALMLAPYLFEGSDFTNLIACSGILNCAINVD